MLKLRKIFTTLIGWMLLSSIVIYTYRCCKKQNHVVEQTEIQKINESSTKSTIEQKHVIKNTEIQTTNGPLTKPTLKFRKDFCPQVFGDVAIVQVLFAGTPTYLQEYIINGLQSMRCYARLRNYTLYQIVYNNKHEIISGFDDIKIHAGCNHLTEIFKKRHCLVGMFLTMHDYVFHIDGDSGVINPNHCLEEYINPKVDLAFLVRAHSGELQTGHYLAKNTKFSQEFFKKWAPQSTWSNEQTSLHDMVSKEFLPPNEHNKCQSLKSKVGYFKWVECIMKGLRERHQPLANKSVLIYSRAQTFVRDGWTTQFMWGDIDFMIHGFKGRDDVLFTRKLKQDDCPVNSSEWELPIKIGYYADSLDKMKEVWKRAETAIHTNKQFAILDDISQCWPNCSHLML